MTHLSRDQRESLGIAKITLYNRCYYLNRNGRLLDPTNKKDKKVILSIQQRLDYYAKLKQKREERRRNKNITNQVSDDFNIFPFIDMNNDLNFDEVSYDIFNDSGDSI
ncbi:hypothetical protein TRFO_01552 [Tritrichomonas foetus]|uniref:Uncharacterized protein n=1 Tax=Tritrichomonas foetus TaxID=1144522 RepID=A0A1J4JYS0_9EUKA|nr:hypothetical protein TRFO_01552 [Tritrichomonas foetus]|eukprot:OHT03842.1 hypothetical protein TRFO_01552 [Tritrichomonas foetus]